MKKNEFYAELLKACELTGTNLDDTTILKDIEGYDSLAIMTMIAFIDDNFRVQLTGKEFDELTTFYSLVEKIGIEKFQND